MYTIKYDIFWTDEQSHNHRTYSKTSIYSISLLCDDWSAFLGEVATAPLLPDFPHFLLHCPLQHGPQVPHTKEGLHSTSSASSQTIWTWCTRCATRTAQRKANIIHSVPPALLQVKKCHNFEGFQHWFLSWFQLRVWVSNELQTAAGLNSSSRMLSHNTSIGSNSKPNSKFYWH